MLNLLLEYAQQEGLATKPGFKVEPVRWLLRFDNTGEYIGATRRGEGKSKGELFRVPRLSQPEMKAGGPGTRHFLCDSAEVVVLFGADEPDAKLTAKHEYFVGLLRQAAECVPPLARIADKLSDSEEMKRIRESLLRFEPPAKTTDNVTIAVEGHKPTILLECDAWHTWYDQFRASLAKNTSDREMPSFASGETVTPAKTQGKITGLSDVGGFSAGDVLASFKQAAFRHYGLVQAENAAVSDEEAAAYRAALNDLLRRRSHQLAGARIAYWYAGPGAKLIGREADPVSIGAGWEEEADEEESDARELTRKQEGELRRQEMAQATQRVRRLLESVEKAEAPELVKTRFYAFSLSGNSGRVVVRDWMEGEFEELARSVLRWLEDLQVTRLDSPTLVTPKLEAVVTSVLAVRKPRQKYKDWIKPVGKLREPLWRAAVRPGASNTDQHKMDVPSIPDGAIGMLLPQWRASILNGEFDAAVVGRPTNDFPQWQLARSRLYARTGLLKTFLIRKGITMEPYLNADHDEPAYHYGRLLAVLADLQRQALGDVGAGVVQRYYARASTAPADALGPLIRLSNAHLDKLDKGLAVYLQDKISEIFGSIRRDEPPGTLDSKEQSLFAMGFYQQIAHMRHEMRERIARKQGTDKTQEETTNEGA